MDVSELPDHATVVTKVNLAEVFCINPDYTAIFLALFISTLMVNHLILIQNQCGIQSTKNKHIIVIFCYKLSISSHRNDVNFTLKMLAILCFLLPFIQLLCCSFKRKLFLKTISAIQKSSVLCFKSHFCFSKPNC